MRAKPLLIVENLCVRLGGRPVLAGIDWRIAAGEQWAILGPNGSGKTTLVKALAGKLPTADGAVHLYPSGGADRFRAATENAIGFVSADLHRAVFEREAFAEEARHFSGNDRTALLARDYILGRRENGSQPASRRIAELKTLSGRFRMQALLAKCVSALTTGDISKMLILRALLRYPRLLILDEPFSGLDRSNKAEVATVIGDLIRAGLHLILITHDIDEIVPEISHVLLLTAGGVQTAGRKEEVLTSRELRKLYRIQYDPLHRGATPVRPARSAPRRFSKREIARGEPAGTKLVEMIDVNVRYGRHLVLRNVNWTVRKGENWRVVGPDGAGKSSLLKLITGDNLQAYANEIYLFGKKKGSGESVWDIKKQIGWISSELQAKYPADVKGLHVVCSGFFDSIGLYHTATSAQRRQAENVLSELNIAELSMQTYGNLSHGQKQMLLIARAIVKPPPLLLLDDPCEGLDFANRAKLVEIIGVVGRTPATTVIYAASDDDVLPCLTHQLRLDRGTATVHCGSAHSPETR